MAAPCLSCPGTELCVILRPWHSCVVDVKVLYGKKGTRQNAYSGHQACSKAVGRQSLPTTLYPALSGAGGGIDQSRRRASDGTRAHAPAFNIAQHSAARIGETGARET